MANLNEEKINVVPWMDWTVVPLGMHVDVRRKMWSGYGFCYLRMLRLLKEIKEFVDGKWDIAP